MNAKQQIRFFYKLLNAISNIVFVDQKASNKHVNKNYTNRFISDYPIVKSHTWPTPYLTCLVIKIKFTQNNKLLNTMSNFTQ